MGAGVECIALDSGPGIADIAVALRDGYSTAGSSGTGLGAVRRLSHDFDHYSRPGLGSAILSRVRPGEPRATTERKGLSWGGVSLAKDGEDASGDAWRVKSKGGDLSIFVVDGLGHGPMAARAAHAAIGVYDVGLGRADLDTITRLHQALRPTRGAAASILHLPQDFERSFLHRRRKRARRRGERPRDAAHGQFQRNARSRAEGGSSVRLSDTRRNSGGAGLRRTRNALVARFLSWLKSTPPDPHRRRSSS